MNLRTDSVLSTGNQTWTWKCGVLSVLQNQQVIFRSQRYGLQGEHCIINLVVNNLEVFIIGDAGGIAALKLGGREADCMENCISGSSVLSPHLGKDLGSLFRGD